jgi:hypothetical protein
MSVPGAAAGVSVRGSDFSCAVSSHQGARAGRAVAASARGSVYAAANGRAPARHTGCKISGAGAQVRAAALSRRPR